MWIEIRHFSVIMHKTTSSPTRGMWIEIAQNRLLRVGSLSSPTRGMWIEIFSVRLRNDTFAVIPHTGDVD